MAEMAVGLLGPVIELGKKCFAEPIKRQFNYLCCFNSNIHDLREEAKRLNGRSEELQGQVNPALNNAEVIVPQVSTWLENAKEFQTNMTGFESEITGIQSGCLAVKSRYLLSRKAKKTTKAMKQLREDSTFQTISHPAESAAVVPTPLGSIHELESRKHVEEEIMTTLKDNKVNIMGLCGMGGVGKTTMAKKIMNKVREEDLFDEAVMAVVSQSVDKLKIQGDMAEQLGLKLEEKSVSSRAHKLHERLKGEKRMLIVLDDVWEDLKLEELIGIPSQSGFEGCKILLTSRNRDVLTKMDAEPILGMETLSEKEAWSLFQEKVGNCVNDQNLTSIAKQVADQCQGLPVALVVVAGALKNQKEKCIWADALEQLKSSNPIDLPDILDKVYIPLKVSFDLLRSPHAESVFLLCCLFPEDYDIPLEDLTVYAMGLRMFQDIRNLKQARDRTCLLVDRLKNRFLLLGSWRKHHVRMHDVVRDVAIYIASSKDRHLIKCGDNCAWFSPSLGERIGLSNGATFPNLRLLFIDESLNEELQINDQFFEGMKGLNVLSMRDSSLGSLPHTTRLLTNFQTLQIESCTSLETISIVAELENLEILICRDCDSIKDLPEEIGKLRRLRLLEISRCCELKKIAPGVISKLDKLEELKLVESFDKWEAGDNNNDGKGRENAGLRELESLSNLRWLEIQIDDSALAAEPIRLSGKLEKFDITLGRRNAGAAVSVFDKKLSLDDLRGETSLGYWIDMQLLSSAEYLESSGDGSNKLDLAKAHQNLRWLTLQNCSTMKKLVNITSSIFPLLESLWLFDLPKLEELCGPIPDQGSSDSFRNLRDLSLDSLPELRHLFKSPYQHHVISNLSSINIHRCDNLRNPFSLATAKDCLLQLESLRISDCDMMEQVLTWNEEEENQTVDIEESPCITFPKLKELWLLSMPNLTTFCRGIQAIEFSVLTNMTIDGCPKLTSLLLSTESGNDENNWASINHDDDSLHWFCQPEKVAFDSLKRLVICRNNILRLWCCEIPIDFFTGLEVLELYDCDKIRGLFSSSLVAKLVNLRKLKIGLCVEMIKVIEDDKEKDACQSMVSLFPNLEELRLSRLLKLESFCELRCAIELPFPVLENLKLENLPNLTTLCKGIFESIEFPMLTEMTIDNCPNLKASLFSSVTIPSSGGINHGDDDSLHLFCEPKVAFGSLKGLEINKYRNTLRLWCRHIPVDFFTRLEQLRIIDCDNIRSLFSSSIARNLINLRSLHISGCGEMVKVIEGEEQEKDAACGDQSQITICLFPRLKELCLVSLSQLEIFCSWRSSCALVLPSLERVAITRCSKMERFCLGSLITPNLLLIDIDRGYNYNTNDLNVAMQKNFLKVKIQPRILRRREWVEEEEEEEEEEDEDEDEEKEREDKEKGAEEDQKRRVEIMEEEEN